MTTNEPATTPQFAIAGLVPIVMSAMIIMITISWGISATKRAWRGEEVSLTELGIARGG